MPDPEKQFILEVDASDTGAGAVLSQGSSDDKVHPCAYFSRRLSPTERNYAVGDRELLALKLALEEWRHLLEGATVPFLVWTDHKNLEYLHSAKLLNPRQARWSIFFNRFNFTLSYRPGSKNVKPDALSRFYPSPTDTEETNTILPTRTMIATTQLNIMEVVERALLGKKLVITCLSPRSQTHTCTIIQKVLVGNRQKGHGGIHRGLFYLRQIQD